MGRTKTRRNSRPNTKGAKTHSCGKMRFNNQRSASMAAELQGEKHGTDLSPYRCRSCLGYHLTSRGAA